MRTFLRIWLTTYDGLNGEPNKMLNRKFGLILDVYMKVL